MLSAIQKTSYDPVLDHTARSAFESFTHIMSHDLHAPLRGIVDFSQLLKANCCDELNDKAHYYIDLIIQNGKKAQRRITGLLQYSRLDTVPLVLEKVNSGKLLDHCLEQLQVDIEMRGGTVYVHPLPEVTADAQRLSLLFYCLLSNAITYCTQSPHIEITAERGCNAWMFCVRDNGIGIDEKDHGRIFDMFERLHHDDCYPGTGIGLALARRIIELHGGLIWVESSPNSGSNFYFTLRDI